MNSILRLTFLISFLWTSVSPPLKAQKKLKTTSQTRTFTLIVKLKPSKRNHFSEHPEWGAEEKGLFRLTGRKQLFPNDRPISTKHVDLSLIHQLTLKSASNGEQLIKSLMASGLFQYVEKEPKPVNIQYVPNDTLDNLSNFTYIPGNFANNWQRAWYLTNIHAYEAWDIWKSDTNTVIGMPDTQFDYTHFELSGQIKYNPGETGLDKYGRDKRTNGIDDENDGYIDNYRGWDLADSTNQVHFPGGNTHGTECASTAVAEPNNIGGFTGTGFYTKLLPVKVGLNSANCNVLSNAYPAIKYLADHGVKVISLSWGEANDFTQYGQDIINYAALNKDVTVIAAAGNSGKEEDFYPACFDNVLSVAFVNYFSCRCGLYYGSTTYSNFIDVSAPGVSLVGASDGNTFISTTGSSGATPLVAGIAATLRSYRPNLNALQVMERIRVTCNSIDTVAAHCSALDQSLPDTNVKEKLGKGLVDMYRALTDSLTPSVRASDYLVSNGITSNIFPGDTALINFKFTNYLSSTTQTQVTLRSVTPGFKILDSVVVLPPLNTLDTFRNNLTPFRVFLSPTDTIQNFTVKIRLGFNDSTAPGGPYTDYQYLYLTLNEPVNFLNVFTDSILVSTTDLGRTGFTDVLQAYLNGLNAGYGQGVQVNGINGLTEAGIIVGTDSGHVASSIRLNYNQALFSKDFLPYSNLTEFKQPSYGNTGSTSVFADTSGNVPVSIEQKTYGNNVPGEKNFVITELNVTNTGSVLLDSLVIGIFADWDVVADNTTNQYLQNRADWDCFNKLGYAYSTDSSLDLPYYGIRLLTTQQPSYYAFDFNSIITGVINPNVNYFTKAEKFATLANGVARTQAGFLSPTGGDIGHIVGAKCYQLNPGETRKIAFAYVGAKDYPSLLTAGSHAASRFAELYAPQIPLVKDQYFCHSDTAWSVTIAPSGGKKFNFYNQLSCNGLIAANDSVLFLTKTVLPDSIYINSADSIAPGRFVKIRLLPDYPDASFSYQPIQPSTSDTVKFVPTNNSYSKYAWQFGYSDSLNSIFPNHRFLQSGNTTVSLKVTDQHGCTDTSSAVVTVHGPTQLLSSKSAGLSQFYPNPTSGVIYWKGDLSEQPSEALVMNDLGQVLITSRFNENKLDVSGLPEGCYLLKVLQNGSFKLYKFAVRSN